MGAGQKLELGVDLPAMAGLCCPSQRQGGQTAVGGGPARIPRPLGDLPPDQRVVRTLEQGLGREHQSHQPVSRLVHRGRPIEVPSEGAGQPRWRGGGQHRRLVEGIVFIEALEPSLPVVDPRRRTPQETPNLDRLPVSRCGHELAGVEQAADLDSDVRLQALQERGLEARYGQVSHPQQRIAGRGPQIGIPHSLDQAGDQRVARHRSLADRPGDVGAPRIAGRRIQDLEQGQVDVLTGQSRQGQHGRSRKVRVVGALQRAPQRWRRAWICELTQTVGRRLRNIEIDVLQQPDQRERPLPRAQAPEAASRRLAYPRRDITELRDDLLAGLGAALDGQRRIHQHGQRVLPNQVVGVAHGLIDNLEVSRARISTQHRQRHHAHAALAVCPHLLGLVHTGQQAARLTDPKRRVADLWRGVGERQLEIGQNDLRGVDRQLLERGHAGALGHGRRITQRGRDAIDLGRPNREPTPGLFSLGCARRR